MVMFLKKKKYKIQWLKKRHLIDLWGLYAKKKKFNQRTFQRMLLKISWASDREIYRWVKAVKTGVFWKGYKDWFINFQASGYKLPPKPVRFNNRNGNPKPFRKRTNFDFPPKKIVPPLPVATKLINYLSHTYTRSTNLLKMRPAPNLVLASNKKLRKSLTRFTTPLLYRWRAKWALKIGRINTARVGKRPELYRWIYIRKSSPRVEMLRQQFYYGFNKMGSYLSRVRKFEIGLNSYKSHHFGLEGLIGHLLYRLNIVLTIRAGHLLVRLGAIHVNEIRVRNLHKCLRVGDVFGFYSRYIKCAHRVFKTFLRRRLIKINVPNYLDYDYRLMSFCIWRTPTVYEQSFLHSLPFRRSVPSTPILTARKTRRSFR